MPNENSYEVALKKSDAIRADLDVNPQNYTMLTGDRPTGRLHLGHYFGTLKVASSFKTKAAAPTCSSPTIR